MRDELRIGEWRVEPDIGKLSRGEKQVQLEPKVMDLLVYLAEHAGKVLPKERLIQAIWPDTFVTDEVLSNAIWLLRKALGDDSRHPSYIETLPRRGYRLIAPVEFPGVASEHRDGSNVRKAAIQPRARRRALGLAVGFVLLGVVLAIAIWFPRTTLAPTEAPTLRAVPFTSYPGSEERPDFSPQGDRIAYQWTAKDDKNGNSDIYVKQIGLGEPLRLTSDSNPEWCPRWSPDGQRIVFARSLADKVAIVEVPALGGSERTLAELRTDALYDQGLTDLSWSPDGRHLAVSFRPHGAIEARCHLLDVDSGHLEACTSPPGGTLGDYFGQFSPAGGTIGFFRRRGWAVWDLYQQSLPKGPVQQLTFESFRSVHGLAWMPDGRQIVFAAEDRLWRVTIAGDGPVPLTGSGENLAREYPSVSRKGRPMAYTQGGPPFQRDIWRLAGPLTQDSSQARAERIISSTRSDDNPQFSPDGTRIAFASNRTGYFEIFVCNSDGSRLRQVTWLKAESGSPTWSPDGRQICFDSWNHDAEIYVVNAEGGTPRRLTTHPAADVTPTWSRDGRWVYFSSNRSGRYEIWKTTVAGSELRQVTRQGGFRGLESVDGTQLYYATGFPGQIMVMPTGGGAETRILEKDLSFTQWDLSSTGIYFRRERNVYFLGFEDGRTRKVLTLNVPNPATFRVSLDGRWFLCSGSDPREGSDIVLVEDFR
ncbi:MAG: winged helix-turn-helix domain-containing protein [Acidobacteriota bacterium]